MLVYVFIYRDNYAEWRTDPTVAIQCHRCDAMFTIKHVGKFNLATDLTRRPTHGRINALVSLNINVEYI